MSQDRASMSWRQLSHLVATEAGGVLPETAEKVLKAFGRIDRGDEDCTLINRFHELCNEDWRKEEPS